MLKLPATGDSFARRLIHQRLGPHAARVSADPRFAVVMPLLKRHVTQLDYLEQRLEKDLRNVITDARSVAREFERALADLTAEPGIDLDNLQTPGPRAVRLLARFTQERAALVSTFDAVLAVIDAHPRP